MIQIQPLEVTQFTGGVTDFIFSSDITSAVILDNFSVQFNQSLLTRPGSIVDDVSPGNGKIPAGNQRIGTLINYDNSSNLLVQSARDVYYRNPSAYTTILGPTGNHVFSNGTTANIISKAEWNKHIFLTHDGFPVPQKIYKDGSGAMRVRNAGLPDLASSPIVTAGAAGANNYVYAFHYSYQYTVENQVFEDDGPVTFVELDNAAAPDINPVSITAIPVLSNGASNNWDTTVITVKIYRTADNGINSFFLGQVTNGTTTYTDNTSDAPLTNSSLLYLSDGSLDNDPTPLSKFVHVVNNTGYYGYIKEGSEEFPFKYRQSIPFDPDSCPLAFEDSVEDVITGFSSVQSIPIILCVRHVYRIEGGFDQFGRGSPNHIRISDNAGCVSNLSLVQAEGQLFWAGNDGFYATDGYTVIKISDDTNDSYKAMLAASSDQRRIYGKFDELNRRIVWGLETDSSSMDNDTLFVLDLRWGVKAASVFTSWSAGDSFRPTALEFFNKKLYRADSRGYVFIHDTIYDTDPLVDTATNPEAWNEKTIIWTYRSIAMNFGTNLYRKIATKILLLAKNSTNVSIQINTINDDGRIFRALKEIRWRRNFVWGDPQFSWGDPLCVWNGEGLIEQWRRMPAKGLRFSYLQVEITNSYTVITNSDTLGTATFNPTTKVITLDDAVANDWPIDARGYFISSEVDGYSRQFEILSRTADTVTVLDPGNNLPSGSNKWLMKGYQKGEILNLLGYTVHWAPISKTQQTYEAGQDGANQ
jgi:hypothetical protein